MERYWVIRFERYMYIRQIYFRSYGDEEDGSLTKTVSQHLQLDQEG